MFSCMYSSITTTGEILLVQLHNEKLLKSGMETPSLNSIIADGVRTE